MTILTKLFQALDAANIRYCVVGNVACLPDIPDNDVDIIVSDDQVSKCRALIYAFASGHGGFVVQVFEHEPGAFYHVLWFPRSDGRGQFVKIDICSNYVRFGRPFLTAAWLLEGRRKVAGRGREPLFFIAAPDREFLYYTMKKVDKDRADKAALLHLARLLKEAPDRCRTAAASIWQSQTLEQLIAAIEAGEPTVFTDVARGARAELVHTLSVPSRSERVGEWLRRWRRVINPTGFVVAVLGPDGAGKSTVLAGLQHRLEPAARTTVVYHLFPVIGTSRSSSIVVDPHSQPPRGLAAGIAKLAFLVLRYNLGWVRAVFWQVRRSALVYFDRYYQDILADPTRYRDSTPPWIVRAFARLIPQPDIFLVLDAPPAVIRSRKIEISEQESERQYLAYRALAASLPRGHLVDVDRPPSEIVAECERLIMTAMASRLSHRNCRPYYDGS